MSQPDYEKARAAIRSTGPLIPENGSSPEELSKVPDGTDWRGQAVPDGPPIPKVRPIPSHLKNILKFFDGIIQDESLIVDLCLERCMEIVRRNVEAKIVGTDHFAGEGQGAANPYTPVNYAAIAGPLSVELYKQVLKAIEGREEEYRKLLEEAARERERNSQPLARIFVP